MCHLEVGLSRSCSGTSRTCGLGFIEGLGGSPYLRLIADDDVILHGVRDVVHGELQEGPLGNVDQADARPGGTAVLGVGSLHHGDTLEGEQPEE